jgi:DNA-directed RNA polymerase subunit beta
MSYLDPSKQIVRRSFGKLKSVVPVPNLIEVQSTSFNDFIQLDYLPAERALIGLEKVLRDIFPIDYEGKMSLEYVSYQLGDWACTCGKLTGIVNRYTWSCNSCRESGCSRLSNDFQCPHCKKKDSARYKTCPACLTRVCLKLPMTVDECRSSGQTFALPLRVTVQLVAWNESTGGTRVIRDIKEQEIFLADVPVMADLYEEDSRYRLGDQGTFLINGIDRVVVSQMHRSPGVVFARSKKMSDLRGRPYYVARIIPMRGSWIDFEFDANDLLYVRIDKKKKLLATTFLQALGIPRDEIIGRFYESESIVVTKGS